MDDLFKLPINGQIRRESLTAELQKTFDVFVGMGEHKEVLKGQSVATCGLCGCIAGYVEREDRVLFFHYPPTQMIMIEFITSKNPAKNIGFFVPGEYQKNAQDKYELLPKSNYTEHFLKNTIKQIKAQGLEPNLYCYNEVQMVGDRYQSTAWITRNGDVAVGGMIVPKNNSNLLKPKN